MGSNDETNWVPLVRHKADQSLNAPFASKTWEVSLPEKEEITAWRYFSVVQTRHNNSETNFLSISGIEFYGEQLGLHLLYLLTIL